MGIIKIILMEDNILLKIQNALFFAKWAMSGFPF